MIEFLHNLALICVKNANFFAEFFGENIFKNHNIGPRKSSNDRELRCLRYRNFCNNFVVFQKKIFSTLKTL
jgi:hypothetical protein